MTFRDSTDEIAIRRAVRADLLDVFRIEQSVFTHPWTMSAFERFLGAPGFLVAETDSPTETVGSDVVGYVVATGVRVNGRPMGHVKDLAVAPSHQGKGIGSRLLERGLRALQDEGYDRARLEVRRSNADAIRLYERFGFQFDHAYPRYYPDGEDAAILMADIDNREGY